MGNMNAHDMAELARQILGTPFGPGPFDAPAARERIEPTIRDAEARGAGLSAVDKAMDQELTDQWRGKMEGRKADIARAGEQGRAAVADATSPSNVRSIISALQRLQQNAWTPEESAAIAQTLGPTAVEGALRQPQNPPGFYPPGAAPMPMTAPGMSIAPQSVAPSPETESTSGYAPSATRAAHWGPKAVENELLNRPSNE